MSKTTFLCEDDKHFFHKWSGWAIEYATIFRGMRWLGKKIGDEGIEQVRVRRCDHCKQIDWRDL